MNNPMNFSYMHYKFIVVTRCLGENRRHSGDSYITNTESVLALFHYYIFLTKYDRIMLA